MTSTSRQAIWAAVLAASLGAACRADAPSPPEAAPPGGVAGGAPGAGEGEGATTGPQASTVAVGPASFLGEIGTSLVASGVEKLLEATGLFDWLGLGGPDEWTRQKLEEISAKLDHLDADIAALGLQLQEIESLIALLPAREAVEEAQVRFGTCYQDRLRLPANPIADAGEVEEYNRARLARAYQAVGLPPPPGLILLDDDCAILEKLNQLQAAILPRAPGASRPLVELAKLARLNGESFEWVGTYFEYVLSIERQGMAILAQAHHRLGKDADLAELVARLEANVRGQVVELLHAAEAYVAYQPVSDPYAADALELADLVASRLDRTTRFVTASELHLRPWITGGPPDMTQGGASVPFDGVLAADGGILPAGDDSAYDGPRQSRIYPEDSSYPYVIGLGTALGVEVGRSARVTISRYRATGILADPPLVVLEDFWPFPDRAVPLVRRNAVTLSPEPAQLDRALLAHPAGLASTMARFELLPGADDPRHVLLAVDQPAWGSADVPVSADVPGVSAPFAARPGVPGTLFELVPSGPADPDRFALRMGDRWVGLAVPPAGEPGDPEPLATVVPVDEPVFFDVTRDGDAYEVSHLAEDGVRRHLFVNEQLLSASDWQVRPPPPFDAQPATEIDLAQIGGAFSEGDPRSFCAPALGQPPTRLSLPIRGGSEADVSYSIRGGLNWMFPYPPFEPPSHTACYLTTGLDEPLFRCWSSSCAYYQTDSQFPYVWGITRQLSASGHHTLWCERTSGWDCVDLGPFTDPPALPLTVH